MSLNACFSEFSHQSYENWKTRQIWLEREKARGHSSEFKIPNGVERNIQGHINRIDLLGGSLKFGNFGSFDVPLRILKFSDFIITAESVYSLVARGNPRGGEILRKEIHWSHKPSTLAVIVGFVMHQMFSPSLWCGLELFGTRTFQSIVEDLHPIHVENQQFF